MDVRSSSGTDSDQLHEPRSHIVLDLLVALLITGWVWFELWQGTVPSLENDVFLLIAVGVGSALGVGIVYADLRGVGRKYWKNDVSFILIMAVLIGLGLLLFPEGLPVSGEVGFLVLVWTGVVTRTILVSTRESD